jgi:hypothetical protein
MAVNVVHLQEFLESIINKGFGDAEVMISIPMGWCQEHNHEMRCYTEFTSFDIDIKRRIILFATPQLDLILQAMAQEHEVH